MKLYEWMAHVKYCFVYRLPVLMRWLGVQVINVSHFHSFFLFMLYVDYYGNRISSTMLDAVDHTSHLPISELSFRSDA
jgi:hypothetical protein